MLSIQEIINEADIRVPNPFDSSQKVTWLNEVNNEFFEIVRIPKVYRFLIVGGTDTYNMPPSVNSQLVEIVRNQSVLYESVQYEVVSPGRSSWFIDDDTKKLILYPRPSINGEGVVLYRKQADTSFLLSNLTARPDAPPKYHWAYILGLCERIAKAMNDVTLANNYASDYRNQLALAQEEFRNRSEIRGDSNG